jgi:hypothetical protein
VNLVTITEDNGHYKVTANTVYIGDIYMEVDGGWVFGPGTRGGFWPARLLREIVAKLDELNHPWPPDEAPTTCTWTRWNGVTAICGCLDAYWHWSAQHNHCPFCGKPIVLVDQARPQGPCEPA